MTASYKNPLKWKSPFVVDFYKCKQPCINQLQKVITDIFFY